MTPHTQRPLAARFFPIRMRTFPILLLGLLVASPVLAAPIGFVTSVSGLVEIRHQDDSDWAPMALDGNILMGDSIGTERNSFAKVLLVDDTTLFIDEETELVIDKLVVGDLATSERSVVRQLRGQLRARVGQAFGGTTRLEIHTPTAIVGVKGSTMEVRVRGEVGRRETFVRNVRGDLFILGKDGRGSPIQLPRGLCSRILEGRRPEPPIPCPIDFAPLREVSPIFASAGSAGSTTSAASEAAVEPLIKASGVAAAAEATAIATDVAAGQSVVSAFLASSSQTFTDVAPQEPVIDGVFGNAEVPPPPVINITTLEAP